MVRVWRNQKTDSSIISKNTQMIMQVERRVISQKDLLQAMTGSELKLCRAERESSTGWSTYMQEDWVQLWAPQH